MALTKQQKADLIAQYTNTFSDDKAIVLLEQRGLPVHGIVSFKKELASTSGTSRVVKKRLLLQTAEKNGFDAVDLGTLSGSLVAISTAEEDFSPLKAVVKMNKLFKKQ